MLGTICVRQSSKRSAQKPLVHRTSSMPTVRILANGLEVVSTTPGPAIAATETSAIQTKMNDLIFISISPIAAQRQESQNCLCR